MGGNPQALRGMSWLEVGAQGAARQGKRRPGTCLLGDWGVWEAGRLVGPDRPHRKATPEPILRCDLACDFNRGRGVVENRASLGMRVGGHRSCRGWEAGGRHRGILGPRLNTEAGLWAERTVGVQTMSTERALQKQD